MSEEKFDFAKYCNDYKKKNYKRITSMIPKTDTEVIEKLESVESVSAYVYALIKQDVENRKK